MWDGKDRETSFNCETCKSKLWMVGREKDDPKNTKGYIHVDLYCKNCGFVTEMVGKSRKLSDKDMAWIQERIALLKGTPSNLRFHLDDPNDPKNPHDSEMPAVEEDDV